MRLVSFTRPDGTASYGTTDGATIHDAGAVLPYADLRAVLAAGATGQLAGKGTALAMSDVTLLSPVPNPDKILCIGLNYMSHIKETGRDKPAYPSIFNRYPSSILGHNVPLVRPKVSKEFDYEGELVAVIGKTGRNIPREAALDHVAGYTLFNDGSIRDYQMATPQWTLGKNFDATGSMGPDYVTADALPAGAKGLMIRTRLNGAVVQEANTDQLIYDVATLVEKLSAVMTLRAGDLIVTGTPSGVGMARKPQLWMKPGDVVEVEVDGVGLLRNRVVAG